MRRSYLSPEFSGYRVYGTFNMVEESNFFGSKMLEIEDIIQIKNQDIIYYQNLKGEQIDYSIESSLQSYVYSSVTNKGTNHTLVLDENQSQIQKEKNTKWVLKIEVEKILKDFIFAELKKYRTFEGITNEMTRYNNIDISIKNYIDFNVKDRYKLNSIDLYIKYKDLRNQNILRYKNLWSSTIAINENKYTRTQRETTIDGSVVTLTFNQEKPSSEYSFEYYFDLNFEKL